MRDVSTVEEKLPNRWLLAGAALVMHLTFGAVGAWSVFRDPLITKYGWTVSEVTLTYTIAYLAFGVAVVFGGLWLGRVGPRKAGLVAGVLYGSGVILAGFAGDQLWLLYLSYGGLSGVGRGVGFMIPIAIMVRWFPDKRGLMSGASLAAHGAGALFVAPAATQLIAIAGTSAAFVVLGAVFVVTVTGPAALLRLPPEGYCPAGWQPSEAQSAERSNRDFTPGEALRTWQWYALWLLVLVHVSTALGLLSQAAPLAQELTGVSAVAAAGLVGVVSVAGTAGPFLWGWISDLVGRRWVFVALFLSQAIVLIALPAVRDFATLAALTAIILLCYGGGAATAPAIVADYYGPKNVGAIYGLMQSAFGVGGFFGSTLIAYSRDATGGYAPALYFLAAVLALSAALPLLLRRPQPIEERQSKPALAKLAG